MINPINVIIADDHPIVRDGLRTILSNDARVHVTGEAATFQELLTLLSTVDADVCVLDVGGMGSSPLGLLARLQREHPGLAVIIFSSSIDLVPELLHAGAKGYIAKEELSEQITAAILSASAGHTFVSPVAGDYLDRCGVKSAQNRLAPQELHVLKLLAQGFGTNEIASHLGIDPRTVQNYIVSLRRKTASDSRTQLVAWYQRLYGAEK